MLELSPQGGGRIREEAGVQAGMNHRRGLEAESMVHWREEGGGEKLEGCLARQGGQWSHAIRKMLVQAWCGGGGWLRVLSRTLNFPELSPLERIRSLTSAPGQKPSASDPQSP